MEKIVYIPETEPKKKTVMRAGLLNLLRRRISSLMGIGSFEKNQKGTILYISQNDIFDFVLSQTHFDTFEKKINYIKNDLIPQIWEFENPYLKIKWRDHNSSKKVDQKDASLNNEDDSDDDLSMVFHDMNMLKSEISQRGFSILNILKCAKKNNREGLNKALNLSNIYIKITSLKDFIGDYWMLLNAEEQEIISNFIKNNI